jgi:hypothetical protein
VGRRLTVWPASIAPRRLGDAHGRRRVSPLAVTVVSGTLRLLNAWARSSDRLLIMLKGEPAPCHFNANPVSRVSAALSVTLQLGYTAPKLPRTTNVRRRRSG